MPPWELHSLHALGPILFCCAAMPRNKQRLYLALYSRTGITPSMPGKEDAYYWALLIGPKNENKSSQGIKCHAKTIITFDDSIKGKETAIMTFQYEERKIWLTAVDSILVRLVLAKVVETDRLLDVLRGTRVKKHGDAGGWNCVHWTRDALERLMEEDGVLGARVLDWVSLTGTAHIRPD